MFVCCRHVLSVFSSLNLLLNNSAVVLLSTNNLRRTFVAGFATSERQPSVSQPPTGEAYPDKWRGDEERERVLLWWACWRRSQPQRRPQDRLHRSQGGRATPRCKHKTTEQAAQIHLVVTLAQPRHPQRHFNHTDSPPTTAIPPVQSDMFAVCHLVTTTCLRRDLFDVWALFFNFWVDCTVLFEWEPLETPCGPALSSSTSTGSTCSCYG